MHKEQNNIFKALRALYDKTKNKLEGPNGYHESFWWEIKFSLDEKKEELKKIKDVSKKVLGIFQKNREIDEKTFFKQLGT